MALGTITDYSGGEIKAIEVLASSTATNGSPAGLGATAGVSFSEIQRELGRMPSDATLLIYSTAGSGTMSASFRLWGYSPCGGGTWYPLGTGGDTTKGVINVGTAIGETASDKIRHAETVSLIGHFERIYLEVVSIGGTSTAVTAQLVARRSYP